MKMDSSAFNDDLTTFVHGGVSPDPTTGAIGVPIYQSTTYVQESVEKYLSKGYSYSRTANPTVRALEKRLAAVEGGADASCFGTGMAATLAVLTTFLSAGDHCVMPKCLYGGTYRAAHEYLTRFGVTFDFVDFRDGNNVKNAIKNNTKLVFCETPANPTLHLSDLEAIDRAIGEEEVRRRNNNNNNNSNNSSSNSSSNSSNSSSSGKHADNEVGVVDSKSVSLESLIGEKRTEERSIIYVVDSTFATPIMLRPFHYGADVVLHSTTKYYDGHNLTTGGVAIARFSQHHAKIAYTRNICGSIMEPQTAFYTLNSSMTLPLRFRRQCATALAVAQYLERHPKVERVLYPGLESHPQRKLALKYHKGGLHGGVLGFDVKGGIEAGIRLMNSVKYPFSLCENLGSAQSLITCPAVFTHAQMTKEQRLEIGVTDGYIRVSIGLEEPQDLINALDKALKDMD